MAKTNTRVPGHELQGEGAPHAPGARRGTHVRQARGVAGTGYGLCTCGARSPLLDSGAKRKAWHRQHKQQMWEANQPWV
jgi:hypothetical protein